MRINISWTWFLCLFTCLGFVAPTKNHKAAPLAPAIYVFGDSLQDSGNNNYLPVLAKANYFPYGANFFSGPTGRFTNGRTTSDFIAEFLGLPYPPPYLSIKGLQNTQGVNYASGSCGILPDSGSQIGACLSMDDQINLFQKTVESQLPIQFKNSIIDIAKYLSNSIFVISVGSNDYINNYFDSFFHSSSSRFAAPHFAQHLVDMLSQQLERLYKIGARKIVLFDVGAIGCTPSVIIALKGHSGKCVEEANQIVSLYNRQLPAMLKHLTSSLPGSTFILGQSYPLSYNAIMKPTKYGFREAQKPCCTFNIGLCIPKLPPCRNVKDHYYWDGYHPTEKVYSKIATECIHGTSICTPMNIKELVQI